MHSSHYLTLVSSIWFGKIKLVSINKKLKICKVCLHIFKVSYINSSTNSCLLFCLGQIICLLLVNRECLFFLCTLKMSFYDCLWLVTMGCFDGSFETRNEGWNPMNEGCPFLMCLFIASLPHSFHLINLLSSH